MLFEVVIFFKYLYILAIWQELNLWILFAESLAWLLCNSFFFPSKSHDLEICAVNLKACTYEKQHSGMETVGHREKIFSVVIWYSIY